MPRPPRAEEFFEAKFITNYMLAGCTPPFDLIVEFAQEPAEDLLLLIFGLDAFDIAQGMFDPKKGRRRKPARHGRKRPRFPGVPDISDEIGRKMRVDEVVENFHKFPGARVAWRALNMYEGVAFSAAVIGGIQDIAFESLWGVFSVERNHCREFARLHQEARGDVPVGTVGDGYWAVNCPDIVFNNGFTGQPFSTQTSVSDYAVSFQARVTNPGLYPYSEGNLSLLNVNTGERFDSGRVTLAAGDSASLSVSGTFKAREICAWQWHDVLGNIVLERPSITAYGESGWLDWTDKWF